MLCARLAALLVLLCTQTRATAPSSAANDPRAGALAGGSRGGPYDLNDPAQLSAAISRYAPEGQLILYAYVNGHETMYRDMGRELALSLDRVRSSSPPNSSDSSFIQQGHGYLVLAHDAAGCAVFFDESPVTLHGGCAVNSVLERYGWGWNSGPEGQGPHTLFIKRYHACALVAAAGCACTLLDSDTVITRDFMPLLREYEKTYALIHLGEGIVNGGMFHLRASNNSAAGLWIIRQVERRSALFHKFGMHDAARKADPGHKDDQDEVSTALRVASSNSSAYDWWEDFQDSHFKDHTFWKRFPQTRPERTWEGWMTTKELYSSPWLKETCPWTDSGRCERLRTFERKNNLRDVPLQYLPICTPWDSDDYDERAPDRCQLALNAPLWMWHHGDPLRKGFEDQIAAYHLLGIELQWLDEGPGSHTSRFVQWLVRPGMEAVRCDPSLRYVAMSDAAVAAAANHTGALRIKALLKRFLSHAVSEGKMPVMPRFSCDSPWIKRGDDSFLGINDLRVVDDGAECFPSAAAFDSCWPFKHFVYPGQLLRQNITWEVYDAVPASTPDSSTLQEYRRACNSYFEELK